jgi:hypothetical protein
VVACSNSPSGPTNVPSAGAGVPAATSAPSAASSAGSSGPGSGAAAEQAVAAAWTAFFDAKTPVSKRVALLEDGDQFSAIIQAQAGSSMASEASANVTKVTLTSPTAATVSYSILLDGEPALNNQNGNAVYESGSWKVGVHSFCTLLTLENGGSAKGLPAVCSASPAAG